MKDNFSTQSQHYAAFRPDYPPELYHFLKETTPHRQLAWDVGTGNGQVAKHLAAHFQRVHATDISRAQLDKAQPHPRISYHCEAAEQCSLPDRSADLVVVGQAIHWFSFDKFFAETRRVLRPQTGKLAAFGYDLLEIDPDVDALLQQFYAKKLGNYWDAERRHIDNRYANIHFPFEEVTDLPPFYIIRHWTRADLQGFLASWSAVEHFKRQHLGSDPVGEWMLQLSEIWSDAAVKTVRFPVFGKICALPLA